MKKWKQFLKEAIVEQANPNKPKAIFISAFALSQNNDSKV